MVIYCYFIIVLIVFRFLIFCSILDYIFVLIYRILIYILIYILVVLVVIVLYFNMGWYNLLLIWGMSNKYLYVFNNEFYIKI